VTSGTIEPTTTSGVRVKRHGACMQLTLDRPAALHAVTVAMRAQIAEALARAARDPDIYAVVLKAAPAKAFCAGGDLRELLSLARQDLAAARQSLAAEYALNWQLECFSKPHLALIDGLVVGSGVGLSLYGTHRVAGPNYRFAMPETGIGLIPDDGVMHVFSRMPAGVGAYLALTGRQIGRADALALGLVTHCVEAARFAEIEAAMVAAKPVDPILDGLHQDQPVGELASLLGVIGRTFTGSTIPDIWSRLAAEGGAQQPWAQQTIDLLTERSPLALAVTLRHLQDCAAMDLRQTLMVDYRLAARCLTAPDFAEGVRAALIDRDGAPRWRPQTSEDVQPGMIERMFRVDPEAELQLPTRSELQAARP
jgi:enoyl-CoA hydratase